MGRFDFWRGATAILLQYILYVEEPDIARLEDELLLDMAALAVAANEMTGPKTTLLSLSCNSFQFRDPFSKIVRNAPIAPPGEPLKSLVQFQLHKLFTKILPIP